MIIGLLQNLYKFLCTQLCENMLQATILFVTTIALIIAIKTYQADVKQKRLKNTIEYIHLFLEGNWISQQDKKYWNEFWQKLDRNACGDFSLTGKFIIHSDGYGDEYTTLDIIEVFSEGKYQHYGRTISNILNIMEYIANKVLCGDLDIDLIKIQLLRFYQLADFYNSILSKDCTKEFYPKSTQLYNKIILCFVTGEPYGNYCEFPIKSN